MSANLGRLSRRQLLKALGAGVAIRPASAFAQGQCGGARAGTPECDPTPAKLPFEPTGWKTVLLDHFSCQAEDYSKEAAYDTALMNWKIRSDDGRHQQSTRPVSRGVRRVLLGDRPLGCEDGREDFQSFHVKDPDGFDLQISNGNGKNRRQGSANGRTSAAGAVRSDHLEDGLARSHLVRGLGLQGNRCVLQRASRLEARAGRGQSESMRDRRRRRHHHSPGIPRQPRRGPDAPPRTRGAGIGHISFGIAPFDADEVKAELEKRGLTARVDTGGRGDIHTASYKSYHTTTPNGFDLQISATTRANRAS
jgi:hypothetical protein